ncbi:phosphoribosyltransferase [uncultured Cardiobacterium sp.]|jgi:protein traN|uniref:phosphoribosyltransferase n=1 Tax=uncultured Cardiobacterium sp. TaxID=417619 RepID=UPI002609B248|nr:phosphoribosyltransferase [uncultured Cardiobacterium sp.]
MTADNKTPITPYTQDGYSQLCERLEDDTVVATLRAHIDTFAADGNRALLKRFTEGLRIAGEMEKACRVGYPTPAEEERRERWDSNFKQLQQHARMAGDQITNADNAAVSRLTAQCERNGRSDTELSVAHDDAYGFAVALRDIPLNEKQTALLWRMAVLTIAEMTDTTPSLAADYLNGTAGEHLGRMLAEKTVYPVTVVSNLAWLLHGQQKSGQLQRDLWHTAKTIGLKMEETKSERAPWGDFPPAITNGFIESLGNLPDYPAAKAGDPKAALRLVEGLLEPKTVEAVRQSFKPDANTYIVPVHAEESAGRNKIPAMIALVLADRLGAKVYDDIVQINRVRRTGSNANHRLAFPPQFKGDVEAGKNYILVDDTLTQGGTLAALRGYIINRGGNVLGVMVMSAKQHSLQLAPSKELLYNVQSKHGDTMNQFWKKEFGYGIEQLTQSEASHVYAAANVDAIRDRIAQARFAAGFGLGETGTDATKTINHELTPVIAALQAENPNAILKTEKPTTPCRGRVVFATDTFIIQQVADGSRYFQAHRKTDLSQIPNIGEKVNISYSAKEPLARVRPIGDKQSRKL